MTAEFAIYKGDDFLFLGTKEECATFLGVMPKTVLWYSYAVYKKRAEKKQEHKRLIVIKIDDEDE